ncbi:uncharacterized protein LOC114167635 [Vigna unguiculata]|uniref:LysM domain-containing protein n=1 Tax=Vigna unguiculata TaxID=3917 RepID=A0A4D6MSI2_VIGUN|nr:uncharacterized protein LOC114167635 [Vigna unguiculata]QCE02835.1 hypothetical protein DEO72_LG8g850 [Vigna unguiculata]QCE02836.1 hypothetical protein DEO72_LG8g851 [Vigna unguiculata]
MASDPTRKRLVLSSKAMADAASWYCAFVLVALLLLTMFRDSSTLPSHVDNNNNNQLMSRPCEEIYVVGEGETLHTISDKCGDPFIVENNPHIHDPDDVFPGLVIKITPSHHA